MDDVIWTIGLAVWVATLLGGIGLVRAGRSPHREAARLMVWASPAGPFAATLLWICTAHPLVLQIMTVSTAIYAIVALFVIKGLAWVDDRDAVAPG